MRIKKRHIEAILLTIHSFNRENGSPIHGLLWESITLGTKRKLQKISTELTRHFKEFSDDLLDVKNSPEEKREAEINILLDEEIELTADPVSMAEIESIKTDKNYSFEIIEMIAK